MRVSLDMWPNILRLCLILFVKKIAIHFTEKNIEKITTIMVCFAGSYAIVRMTMCQITMCWKFNIFSFICAKCQKTPASRPGVARCSLRSQIFAHPLLFYCWSLHVVRVVKTTFRHIVIQHIAHSTLFLFLIQ